MPVRHILLAATIAGVATTAHAAQVDLNTWAGAEGGSSNWVIQGGGDSVLQTVNGDPTVFHNGEDSQLKKLSGTIEVETTGDDDYIGFVLGFNSGDFGNAMADYMLIDWKQSNQVFHGCLGSAGLAISRVSGPLGDNSGAWCHDSANNVTELARATNLGGTGWADNTEYTFDLTFRSNLIEVFVDGVKEISLAGSFANGSFGFYNYSQGSVRYAGLEEDVIPPTVPLPATLPLLAGAVAAALGLRRRRH